MSAISTYLEYIRSKIYAKDVRTAIVNAISQCYNDVNNPTLLTDGIYTIIQNFINDGTIGEAMLEATGYLTESTRNLFDFGNVVTGRINTNTGEIDTTATGYRTSKLIPVTKDTVYIFVNSDRRVFFNSSSQYSSNISATTWTATANGFVRVSCALSSMKTCAMYADYREYQYIPGRTPIDIIARDLAERIADKIEQSFEVTKNLFDRSTVTYGNYVDGSTGKLVYSTNYATSDYIPVTAGTAYYITNRAYACLYDSQKNWVANVGGASFTPTVNGYLRVSCTLANLDKTQVEIGNKATEYRPHYGAKDFYLRDNSYTKTEIDDIISEIDVETDTTLTLPGVPADAKAVGDALSMLDYRVSALEAGSGGDVPDADTTRY